MTAYIERRAIVLQGMTRWGIFTNLWPDATSRTDRADGLWYFHVHTPFGILYVHATAR